MVASRSCWSRRAAIVAALGGTAGALLSRIGSAQAADKMTRAQAEYQGTPNGLYSCIAAACARCSRRRMPARWSRARSARTAGARPSRCRISSLVTSPRLRGEVDAKRRVRGTPRVSMRRQPLTPNPLPVRTGRGSQSSRAFENANELTRRVVSSRIRVRVIGGSARWLQFSRSQSRQLTPIGVPSVLSRSMPVA
jgi:hypothetical protein